jgi:putative NIF3 family GTP cyclohydrolase 1 type 2
VAAPSLAEVVDILREIAPIELAAEWDNVGLLVRPFAPARKVGRALLCVDMSVAVVAEARAAKADLVVSYHPPIFHGFKKLHADGGVQEAVLAAAAAGLAVYSPHTALDAAPSGLCDWLVEQLLAGAPPKELRPCGDGEFGRLAVLAKPLPMATLLDADFTFLNEDLARHYGIDGVKGRDFRKVTLTDARRHGILGHGSFHLLTSYPVRTSPVLRGKWIMENILGTPPPPPPPNVPELNTSEVGNTGTLRQQMEKHRANATCAVCHNKMDALGFGLENFDAVGQWRTKDGNFPIEPGGALPGNKSFKTPAELRALIKADPKYFSRCLTEKLMTYALGRGLEKFDRPTVSKICNKLASDGYRMSSLIDGIVESLPFQYRK